MDTARIIEIFPSIQGEGLYAGFPHLFVRFWNCNLACGYCDTDYRGPYQEYSRERLEDEVAQLLQTAGPFQAVSLTGGEPLLWSKFLAGWLPWLKGLNQTVYLETNGTLPAALSEVLPWVDIIAMDLKPPSATGDRPVWKEHEEFLRLAHQSGRKLFIKIVVTAQMMEEDLRRSMDLIASVSRDIPLVLQPVTPWGPVQERPSGEQLGQWRRLAGGSLTDVRVLPQIHRLLGVQ